MCCKGKPTSNCSLHEFCTLLYNLQYQMKNVSFKHMWQPEHRFDPTSYRIIWFHQLILSLILDNLIVNPGLKNFLFFPVSLCNMYPTFNRIPVNYSNTIILTYRRILSDDSLLDRWGSPALIRFSRLHYIFCRRWVGIFFCPFPKRRQKFQKDLRMKFGYLEGQFIDFMEDSGG